MLSFWPWKKTDASSPASFEKTLSALSIKIADTQSRLDQARSSGRRTKVLWTLYLSFAYVVYAIVLLLVIGYGNLGAYEWTGMAGGPVLIYGTRALITTLFGFRTDRLAHRLRDQLETRAKTIQKLKDATKYDSTMELIEKYGGPNRPRSRTAVESDSDSEAKSTTATAPNRTSMPPPLTANIPRSHNHHDARIRPRPSTPPLQQQQPQSSPGAEFAPNAFSSHVSYAQPAVSDSRHWYDRIFDVLLGEDEAAPKNRIALICQSCRLVNGQAPPGTKSLAELGSWRCMACGALNDEAASVLGDGLDRDDPSTGSRLRPATSDKTTSADEDDDNAAAKGTDKDTTENPGAGSGPATGVRSRRAKGIK
ncbi:hypothetical protein L249_1686 [Ophiocordyceps polyrhachis-furcata BCC 54312]|uniref:Endoplasmic reticulum junction formation protein lunapark n=1 Tax=Ophiocordyceps polyrhachis-furcata BCC 54312 TaxID=1330021 RepID=A0A367LQ00_9HYPO|nr:hypothetical protein L249_1686 [Ophiocordyceps polyrhachis-furcata BCC 54312]